MAEDKMRRIEHGSEDHAQLLGLRKAGKDEKYQYEGWTLIDITQWGPSATSDYINAQLIQRVNEFKSKPVVSGPSMWTPRG